MAIVFLQNGLNVLQPLYLIVGIVSIVVGGVFAYIKLTNKNQETETKHGMMLEALQAEVHGIKMDIKETKALNESRNDKILDKLEEIGLDVNAIQTELKLSKK